MLFTQPEFLFYFLPFALVVHRLVLFFDKRGGYGIRSRLCFFFLTLLFYGFWSPWWLLPFLLSVAFDFLWISLLQRKGSNRKRKLFLLLSIFQNVSLLIFFKYWNFILGQAWPYFPQTVGAFPRFFVGNDLGSLPPGISFYTLESLSLVIDVYRKEVAAPVGLTEFLGFIGMFPRFIAGPITRFREIAPQFQLYRGMNVERGLSLFVLGLFTKICFGDHFALFVHYAFDSVGPLGFFSAWFGVIAYAMQLYFDFSGYSLMAIGLGGCFGFDYPLNFNSPYLSLSVGEFWGRWHITFGRWIRDYLFFPLALKARRSRVKMLGVVALTMAIAGFWHGGNWTFLVMGLWFGLCLCAEQFFSVRARFPSALAWLLTMACVLVGWVFFRARDLPEAWRVLAAMGNPFHSGPRLNFTPFIVNPIAGVFCLLGLVYCFYLEPTQRFQERPFSGKGRVVLVGMLLCALLVGASEHVIPFLYFQF